MRKTSTMTTAGTSALHHPERPSPARYRGPAQATTISRPTAHTALAATFSRLNLQRADARVGARGRQRNPQPGRKSDQQHGR